MKKVIAVLVLMAVSTVAMAADVVLTVTIPDAKVAIAAQRFLRLLPNNETIDDPEWVDPKDGTQPNQIAKYDTTKKWVQEYLYRVLVRECHRGKRLLELDANDSPIDTTLARSGV